MEVLTLAKTVQNFVRTALHAIAFIVIILMADVGFAALTTKTGDTADAQIKTFSDLIEQSKKTCESHQAFIESYEYLKADKDLALNEARSMQLALEISKGCTGAADRFRKVFSLLKKTGVDLRKSVEVGLQFSSLTDERTQNFENVFKKMFLENYFDFDFPTAYKVSFELSSELKEKIKNTGEDFTNIVKFCMENKGLSLPVRECAQYTLSLVKSSRLYPFGLYRDFERLYGFLTSGNGLKLSVRDALATCVDVLQFGPTATNNFIKTYDYASAKEKMQLNQKQAIKLALLVAQNSLTSVETAELEFSKPTDDKNTNTSVSGSAKNAESATVKIKDSGALKK